MRGGAITEFAAHRPLSLDSAAGKDPVNRLGKLYDVLAGRVACSSVAERPRISLAQGYALSESARPINNPQRLSSRSASPTRTTGGLRARIPAAARTTTPHSLPVMATGRGAL